jgi:hypothetical protein
MPLPGASAETRFLVVVISRAVRALRNQPNQATVFVPIDLREEYAGAR